jgi:hypothetical protein
VRWRWVFDSIHFHYVDNWGVFVDFVKFVIDSESNEITLNGRSFNLPENFPFRSYQRQFEFFRGRRLAMAGVGLQQA